MHEGHWHPPNAGHTSLVTHLNTGEFTTLGDSGHSVQVAHAEGGKKISRKGLSKSQNPTAGGQAHRSSRKTSASECYGPAGVVKVQRSYHGPGCPCCGECSTYTMPSAFSEKRGFTGGKETGYREG
ncbi:hypothetical protein ABZ543_12770 [Streptomyces roseifaciens]